MLYFILFFLGLAIGSFLNAWMWRVRVGKSVIKGRSVCTVCTEQIVWYDNIPVVSFICLTGKCRKCKKPISWQYILVELWMGLAFLALGFFYNVFNVELVRDLFIISGLTFIFIYDLKYKEILDRITLPLSLLLFIFSIIYSWHTWQNMSVAITIGAGFFLLQYIISKGRWIGGGDIRMGLLMGIILGWPNIILGLFLAYILGAIISLILIALKNKKMASETPFGTYLAIGTIIAMYFGDFIVNWYLGLLS
jgi:prepilin signal peptidase PulO-like enzyme (type II secretory pathway)